MRLLVVEDDRLLNNTLCYNLSAVGYTVDAAMTKSEAVRAAVKDYYDRQGVAYDPERFPDRISCEAAADTSV